jgi:hypothetical protein
MPTIIACADWESRSHLTREAMMEKRTKAMIGAAAGVAAAAAVAGIVAVRRSGTAPTVYRVSPGKDGWTVGTAGSDGAGSSGGMFATKREAVGVARKLAAENAPSQLVIQRTDGTIQTRHAYGIDAG